MVLSLADASNTYAREKAEHLARQQAKEAALKRELAEKLERQAAAEREAHLKRKKLEEQVAAQRRKDLIAANRALTASTSGTLPAAASSPAAGPSSTAKPLHTAKSLEYDPFAEDEFSHIPLAATAAPKKGRSLANGGGAVDAIAAAANTTASSSGGAGKKSSGKGDKDGAGVKKQRRRGSDSDDDDRGRRDGGNAAGLGLSRKEKANMAFEAQMRKARADKSFVVPGQAPPPKPAPGHGAKGRSLPAAAGNGRPSAGPSRLGGAAHSNGRPVPSTSSSTGSKPLNRPHAGLTRIEAKNRDPRSYDEVQADRRARLGSSNAAAGGTGGASPASSAAAARGSATAGGRGGKSGSRSLSPTKGRPVNTTGKDLNAGANGIIKKERERVVIPTTARPRSALNPTADPAPAQAARRPRQRSPSTSSASSSTSYERDDDHPRDRRRGPTGKRQRSITPDENNYSSIIQSMFKRPGGSGPARPRREVFSDDDDFSDDMEARLDDIEMEEKRGARIARKEDEDAEREERERRERKERMKRERERARGR